MSQICLPATRAASHASGPSARWIRAGWLVGGHAVLLLVAAHIALNQPGFLVGADLAFWLTVAALLGVRYLDITRFHGQTVAQQEPATVGHWHDYAVVTVMFSLGLWLLSHGLAMLAESA